MGMYDEKSVVVLVLLNDCVSIVAEECFILNKPLIIITRFDDKLKAAHLVDIVCISRFV